MSEAVTFTLPEIPAESFAILETLHTEQAASTAAALRAIRLKYAALAKHAGFIRIGHWTRGNQNWRESKDYYHEEAGKKVHGLLAYDFFTDEKDEEFAGRYTGFRIYLTEKGEWLLIARDGRWSQWQNSPDYWICDPGGFEDAFEEWLPVGANFKTINDEDLAKRVSLDKILMELNQSLKTLSEKLPQRMAKLRQKSALAAQVVEALGKGERA